MTDSEDTDSANYQPYSVSRRGTERSDVVNYRVSDVALQRRIVEDLLGRLPRGTDFVVDVATFTDTDVEIKLDRGTYLVTFNLAIGPRNELYERAIRYCVDLIVDHQRGRQPPTHDPTEALTRFPVDSGLERPRLAAIGATADVYQAMDSALERHVAVKVFRDTDTGTVERAVAEARRLGSVAHHCIPKLFRLSTPDHSRQQLPYLVQEWRVGKPLSNPTVLESFLRLSYGRRIDHFASICNAVSSLHRSGHAHGDIHGGNVIYDEVTDTITLIDLGATPPVDSISEFGRTDAQSLGRLFLATVCVPPLPIYSDLVTRVGSVGELLTLLTEFPLDMISESPTSNELSSHAEQRYVRMSEWLHRFRQVFEISARVSFHYNRDLDEPLNLTFDHSSHRAIIECGKSYDLYDEFRSFALVLLRIFLRDWARRQRSTLDSVEEGRPAGHELPPGDRSQKLRAGVGLKLEELFLGIANLVRPNPGPVARLATTEPAVRSRIEFFSYAQLFHEAAVVDWLRTTARVGTFGGLNNQQLAALDRLVDDRSSFDACTLIPRIRQTAELCQRSLSTTEVEALAELEHRCSRFTTWSNAAFAVLAEGVSMHLSSCATGYIATAIDSRSRELKIHRYGTWQLDGTWTSSAVKILRYADEDGLVSVEVGGEAMLDMAAVMAFEGCARGSSSESFFCGWASVHGRFGIGNILGLGHRLGLVEDGWEALAASALKFATASERDRARFGVRMRDLHEGFTTDMRRAASDGRIAINSGLSHDCVTLLRKFGLVTIEKFSSGDHVVIVGDPTPQDDEEVLNQWVNAEIDKTWSRIIDLLEGL